MMIEWGLSQNTRNDYLKSIAAMLNEEFAKRDSQTNAKTPRLDVGFHTNVNNASPKMKVFWEVFNGLAGSENNDVEDKALNIELVRTGKFAEAEARKYVMTVYEERRISLMKTGLWKKV